MLLWEITKAIDTHCAGLVSGMDCVYNIFKGKQHYKEGIIMETLAAKRFEVCRNHPEKEAIFYLEKLLIEAGYPYHFNFWDELKGRFGEPDKDPESINWNEYPFLIEIGRPATCGISEISVCFNTQEGDPKLLELLDMRMVIDNLDASAEDGELHCDLTAEAAMEIIEKYFKTA